MWQRRTTVIALFSVASILLHVLLRFGLRQGPEVSQLPLLATFVVGGIPLVYELLAKLWKREFGSDVLAGISIVTSLLLGEYLAGAIVILMLAGGEALEQYALRSASSVLAALAKRMPSVAHRKRDAEIADIALDEVAVQDTLVLYPHDICPVDGVVIDGHGVMDESYLTGEPFQITKTSGSTVISGAINGESALTIRVTRRAADLALRENHGGDARVRREAATAAALGRPVRRGVHAGRAGFGGSRVGRQRRPDSFFGGSRHCDAMPAADRDPHCHYRLDLAVRAPRHHCEKSGCVGTNRRLPHRDFRQNRHADVRRTEADGTDCRARFQPKTGAHRGRQPGAILETSAGARHFGCSKEAGIELPQSTEVSEPPGQGLRGTISGHQVLVTSRGSLIAQNDCWRGRAPAHRWRIECVVAIDDRYAATLRFRDAPRADSRSFVKHLGPKHQFQRIMMVSGDRETEVRYLAELVGITEIHAQKSPEEKLAIVRQETARAKTLYVGDGINDAPAMLAATVGMAIGQNSDVTTEAAGVVIMDNSLEKVDEFMHISRRMRSIALQSAVGGMFLSIAGMVFAATGHLSPVGGAIAQEVIDVLAVLNALRAALPPKVISDL